MDVLLKNCKRGKELFSKLRYSAALAVSVRRLRRSCLTAFPRLPCRLALGREQTARAPLFQCLPLAALHAITRCLLRLPSG